GMSLSARDFQARGLRRNRVIATVLLGAIAALFVSTTLAPQPGFWILLVRATAEAALVGGLADWFAVTALFRQPLGLPIPHTAIIATRKDRIGRALGNFVQNNFLSREVLTQKLKSKAIGASAARWLSEPENAHLIAQHVAS